MRMRNVGLFWTPLLGLCLIFCQPQTEACGDFGSLPPKPNIHYFSDKQSLEVSWPRNWGASGSDVYEIQISRTENRTVIYAENVSISAWDSAWYTWTWHSDLPLECVDHSVRMRSFCHQTAPSPWSNWITHQGTKATDKTKIFPSQQILKEGNNAIFCCVPPVGVNITQITFRNRQYTLLNIGDGVMAISVTNLAIPNILIKWLMLTCFDSTGKSSSTLNYISFPPQKPKDLNCTTSDMKNIICRWDPGRERDPFDRNNQTHTLYIENADQAPVNCQPTSCTFPAIPQQQEYKIRLEVKDQLGDEMVTYSFNISDRVTPVLKWNKEIPGVTDVILSWTVQGNLTHVNLICQVSTETNFQETIRELTCSSENITCEVHLKDLHPNTAYSAKVRCSGNRRFWGIWTQPVTFKTDLLVILDLWRRIQSTADSDIRHVTLLWKALVFGRATTVHIQSCVVKWSQEGQTLTEQIDKGLSQANISIGPKKWNVTVEAVLNMESSISAHITIPPKDDSEIPPLKKRLSGTSASGFHLWWNEQASVTCGYTVEWCSLESKASCTLEWVKVPEGNNTFIPAGYFKRGYRYSFNIYGCTKHGDKLLEIQSGYIQEHTESVEPPSLNEPVEMTYASVTLEWHYNEDDPAHSALITGYLVTVHEVHSDTRGGQATISFNVTVNDPWQKSVTIEGLQQHQQYVCSVRALTRVGPGSPASITIRTKINYLSHLAKILTPILLLMGCIILLWPQRKKLKNGLRKIFVYPPGMNIKPPEFESFLYETNQKLQSQKEEECISCDIEVLNVKPFWHEIKTLRDSDHTNALCSPTSCVPLQTGYCPQSAVLLCKRPAHLEMMSIANKSYLGY